MTRPTKLSITGLAGEAAFAAVFEKLRPRLVALIERRISKKLAVRVDPEGVVQDAYSRAWPRWRSLAAKPADVDVWIYCQVQDRLVESIRGSLGAKRDVGRDLRWSDGSTDSVAAQLVDSQTGPESKFSRAERRDAVHRALEKLEEIDREIVALRYFDGLNYGQIGTILGLSENAATKRGLRALLALRNHIPVSLRPHEAREP